MSLVVCLDLDGVLNVMEKWQEGRPLDPPRPGAADFIRRLVERGFVVVVHTTRWAPAVWEWLAANQLETYISAVTDKKIPAYIYIDDRAICFRGDFDQTLTELLSFRAHYEPARQVSTIYFS